MQDKKKEVEEILNDIKDFYVSLNKQLETMEKAYSENKS